jgi:nicotinamidase-related amidase
MKGQCLLLLDLMQRQVDELGNAQLMAAWTTAEQAARSAGVPIAYIRIAFRDGYPEVSANNALFADLAAHQVLLEADPQTAIATQLSPAPHDTIITKRRVSAFSGSDLAVVLRGLNTTTLVLAGLHTSGVVLSTLTEAIDLDYRIVVLADGCADPNQQLHDTLITEFFPLRSDVMTSAQWAMSLREQSD